MVKNMKRYIKVFSKTLLKLILFTIRKVTPIIAVIHTIITLIALIFCVPFKIREYIIPVEGSTIFEDNA